jgi:hypothetical protein
MNNLILIWRFLLLPAMIRYTSVVLQAILEYNQRLRFSKRWGISHLAKHEIAVNIKVTIAKNITLFGYNGPVTEMVRES